MLMLPALWLDHSMHAPRVAALSLNSHMHEQGARAFVDALFIVVSTVRLCNLDLAKACRLSASSKVAGALVFVHRSSGTLLLDQFCSCKS